MLGPWRPTRPSSASTSKPSRPTPNGCRFRIRASTWCFGHAVLHHIPDLDRAAAEFLRVLARWHGHLLRRALAPTATSSRPLPKRAAIAAAADLAPGRRRRPAWRRRRPDPDYGHALESEVDVHAFEPRRICGDLRRRRLRPGADPGRGAARQPLRLVASHGRGDRRAGRRSRRAGASSPSAATSACSGSTTRCSSRTCRRELFYNLVFSARRPD